MKYSLRSLMLVVTLVCVLLGILMARVEHLRRQAAFHERESLRYRAIARSKSESAAEVREAFWNATARHLMLSRTYREAAFRPWIIVKDYEIPDPFDEINRSFKAEDKKGRP